MIVRPELFHIIEPRVGATVAHHRHPFTELTWIEGAAVVYRHNNDRIRIRNGELFVMPALTGHGWQAPSAGSRFHGFMLSVQPTEAAGDSLPFHLEAAAAAVGYRLPLPSEARAALTAMERHAAESTPGATAIAAGYMHAALGLIVKELAKTYATSCPTGQPPTVEGAERLFIRARDYILASLHRHPSLPEVAAHVGITARHLNRVFTARLGLPAGAFMLNARIERARHLLHEPGARTKSVAHDCGFNDSTYFCRAFRRQVGLTPTAYARSLR
jgi:AraC-like DNA-binding protein